nr:MAG TPA: hypothetical protein [Caudoviricetes sp.]
MLNLLFLTIFYYLVYQTLYYTIKACYYIIHQFFLFFFITFLFLRNIHGIEFCQEIFKIIHFRVSNL